MEDKDISIITNRMHTICEQYEKRMRQSDIAEKVGLSVSQVGKVLRARDYRHGIHLTADTLKPGQARNAFINLNDFTYLLNCDKIDTLIE